MNRLYLVVGGLLIFAILVVVKLIDIQMVDGEIYKAKAIEKTEQVFTIAPNRGNIYADDGSLLAASVAQYEIRFDANTIKPNVWEENIEPLSKVTEDPLSLLRQIEGYQYNWKKSYSNNQRKQWGVLAQQLESIGINNAVTGTSQKAVNYLFLIPLLIEAVKQLADITTEEVECD